MRLTSIEFENFRCFEKEKIDLHPQVNVFVGLNASGKTALLEGVVSGMSKFLLGLLENDEISMFVGLKQSDLRQSTVAGKPKKSEFMAISCTANIPTAQQLCVWHQTFGEQATESKGSFTDSASYTRHLRQRESNAKNNAAFDLPILLYFSTQRLWGGKDSGYSLDKTIENGQERLAGYVSALSKNSNTYFFEKEFQRMQLVASQAKELNFPHDSSRLDLIRRLSAKAIEDSRIFYYDYEKQSLAIMFKDGRRLAINELSDGQKSLLLICIGIAFQCATLNPHMGLDAYKSSGVVLIDEVELHLHPDWQRQILPILTREFPNIQFICTTHSPQVISSLKPENVQVLKDFKVSPISSYITGRDTNSILREVFGVHERPDEFTIKLNRFYHALDAEDLPTAESTFHELEENWGVLDSEIVQAGWRLQDLQAELARK
jgi:predicted ATP-binding protein involved in virulence